MNIFLWSGVLAFILGTLYYKNMSASIPKEVNCSFSANIWTDVLAFIAGGIIIRQSIIHDDVVLNIIGVAIITEHIWQFYYNKIERYN